MKISDFFLPYCLYWKHMRFSPKSQNKKQTEVCFFVQLEFFTFTSCFWFTFTFYRRFFIEFTFACFLKSTSFSNRTFETTKCIIKWFILAYYCFWHFFHSLQVQNLYNHTTYRKECQVFSVSMMYPLFIIQIRKPTAKLQLVFLCLESFTLLSGFGKGNVLNLIVEQELLNELSVAHVRIQVNDIV